MKKLIAKIRAILRNRRVRKIWTRTVSSTACLVVFVTTYALILPAITMESEASCGIEAHQHDESCYEERLLCNIPESDGHAHTDDCYTTIQKLICDRSEHLHTSDCYDEEGNLICSQEEHQHGKECYVETRELICGLEESEGHHHDSSCYEKVLTCKKEVHTHSPACYREDAASVATTEHAAIAATTTTSAEDAAIDEAANASGTFDPAETAAEGYVPTLDELDFRQLLNDHTTIYYHRPEGSTEDSGQITDWQKVDEDTVLEETDILRVYLAYTIPAGSLNETNATARYRLPGNLHLTDEQMEAINQTENGLSGLYVDYDTLQITDTEKHSAYLGAEAVDGLRTPDQTIEDYLSGNNDANEGEQTAQEIISAVVKADQVYDEDGVYGKKGAYLGTDLVFTFSPYTILKNRNEYDSEGTPVKAGESVSGWFALDFNMDQVDWDGNAAEITFVSEDNDLNTGLVSVALKKADPTSEETPEETNPSSEESPDSNNSDDEKTFNENSSTEENKAETVEETHPAVSFEDSLTVHTGNLSSDTDAGNLPNSSKMTVSVSAEAGTFPAGTTMVLSAVTDMDAVAEAVEGTVDSKTCGFQAVDISFRDKDGNEIEPLKPISVTMRSDSIKAATEDSSMAPVVVHVEDQSKKPTDAASDLVTVMETLPSSVNNDDDSESHGITDPSETISFKADSFSIYAIVYTVDFHYEVNGKMYEFSIPGGGFVSLEQIVEALSIYKTGENETAEEEEVKLNEAKVSEAAKTFVADVENVEFSQPDLVWVEKVEEATTVGELKEGLGLEVEYSAELTEEQIAEINQSTVEEGDWALISMRPFDTEEFLTVTMKNGDSFQICVTDAQIRKTVIDAKGDTWEITVTYGEEAQIPEGAELKVSEILPETDEYYEYYRRAADLVCEDEEDGNRHGYGRLFDISIWNGEEEIEPQSMVEVSIKLANAPEDRDELRVVHFGENAPEVMSLEEMPESAVLSENAVEEERKETELRFETTSFSLYAVVSTNTTNGSGLGGKKFAIINQNVNEAVLGRTNNRNRIAASSVSRQTINGTNYVIADEVTLWEFVSVGGNVYNLKAPDGRYLNITGRGTATLSTDPMNITVTQNGNGLRLSGTNNFALNAWNSSVTDGFGGGNYNNDGERFALYSVNELIQNQADKISLTDLINLHNGETPIEEVVVYTRVLNRDHDGYDYYAVASDGSLVPVYDIGDTIGWVSSNDTPEHLKWKLTVHSNGGEHNGYFDFQSMETGKYLIPTEETGLKDDDPADSWDLGVNMQGWSNGTYGSTIERWDTGTREYVGYGYDAVNKKIVPTADDSQKLEFLFAHVKEDTAQNQLHTVETLDGKTKGITIKMYDFDGNNLYPSWPPRSREMTNVMGENSTGSTNINGVGYANTGLVSETLNNEGFPRATQTNRWLSDLFNSSHQKSTEDKTSNIFVKQVYDETGYFSYDSSKNYAYLSNDGFILYRELAAPEMEGDTTPSANKGNFFPFDSLQDLANRNQVFTNRYVKYDGDLQEMTPDNPQYGDTLYRIAKGDTNNYKSYFFGMTMEADFYQGPDGKDERGNDIIYEFNGDDDMWLYIDNRLVLDIGGCHGAVSGTINFSTGEVRVNGSQNQVHTTLKQIFQDAGRLPDGSNWTTAGAEKWFKGDTFADYTKHSFKMFYMERGSYASNLKMNFNLLTIEPGAFVLEKKLPESVQAAYGDQLFAYQIYTVNGNQETLYTPPTGRYVTYEKSGERVVPEGQTESAAFKQSYTVNGQTYQNVYFLKAGESIVIPTANNEVRYYVKEIGIDPLYEEVKANGRELTISKEGDSRVAQTSTDVIKTRGRVTYENVPKEVHNLRMEKAILGPVRNPDDSFRFDVQLEDAKTGQLVPFNQGKYYIVKTDEAGVDQYYKYENGVLVQSSEPVAYKAGLSGSIDHIFPGYTILITGLLPGTDFKVVENQSANEYPEGYEYVKTEVEHAGEPEVDGAQGKILSKVDGSGNTQDNALDAHVTITNTSDLKTDITVEKTWTGENYEAVKSTLVLYKVIGNAGDPAAGKPESKVRVLIQAAPAPVVTDQGYITVNYTGRKSDGTEDRGSFSLNNTDGWSKTFEFDRGGEYSFTYTPDGTRVLTVVPDQTEAVTQTTTVTLSTTVAELTKYTYTFTVPEGQRPQKGSITVTFNGTEKTVGSSNGWTAAFEAAEGTPVSYQVVPDGKFITGVTADPGAASPASRNVQVVMNPTVEELTMNVPVTVDWSQSTTAVPADTQVTVKFAAQGQEDRTVVLESGNWNRSITLDRLDSNGDLIKYSVQATVTTSDTKKIVTLENVPASISGAGSVNATGNVKSKGVVRVSVQRGIYWGNDFNQYTFKEQLPVAEFNPGDTIIVNIRRKAHSNLNVKYRTSDGKAGTIPLTAYNQDYGMHPASFEVKLPDTPGDYTIVVDDPWGDGAELVSVVKKPGAGTNSVQSVRRTLRKAPAVSVSYHLASPEQKFYDGNAGGSGDTPFKTILYKDLPAGAIEVETFELTGTGTKKWEGLSTFDEDGNPIYYYVVERDATAKADEMEVTYQYTYREDGTIEKVEIVNHATGRLEPDTKEFSFTKVWKDPLGSATLSWPTDKSITVSIWQAGESSESILYAEYTIHDTDLIANHEIAAAGDTEGEKSKLLVISTEADGYVFRLSGLPYEYTYYVSEATVDGYQPPKYFAADGNQVMGAQRIGDGGTICNDQIGYVLPSTGGPGTRFFTILGIMLTVFAGLGLVMRKRRRDAA